MRALLLFMILLVLCTPGCAPDSPVVPSLSVSLSPKEVWLNGSEKAQEVIFEGTVRVEASQFSSMKVTLSGGTSSNWSARCSPESLDLTGTDSKKFTCTVLVPANVTKENPKVEETATVEGSGQTMFLTVVNTATANINIRRSPANATLPGGGAGQDTPSDGDMRPAGINPTAYLMAGAVLAVVGGCGSALSRRLKRRRAALRV